MRKQRKKVFAKSYVIIFMMFLTVSIFSISTTYVMGTHIVLTPEEEQKVTTEIALLATNEGIIFENYQYILQDVHLANEQKIGYVIEFDFQGQYGYSIIFKLEDEIKIVEVFFGRRSPFFEKMGTYIYPSLGTYIIKFNGQYYDLTNGDTYSHLEIKNSNGFSATRGSDKGNTKQTISLSYKREYSNTYNIPNFYDRYYTSLTTHTNNCANTAGLILINYWNKKFDNDLLNLESDDLDSDGNLYFRKGTEIMTTFYDYMNTNWFFGLAGGTLPDDFYNGFRKLVRENGYEVKSKNAYSIFFPDYSEIRGHILRGTPIAITSTDYFFTPEGNSLPNIYNPINGNYKLDIEYERSKGIGTSHMFIAYGYAYYTLYRDVEVSVWSPVWYNPFRYITEIREEQYEEQLLKVATGWGNSQFFNYSRSNLYDVVAIGVHK